MIIYLVNFFFYCTTQTGKDVVTKNFLQCMWKVRERQLMESVCQLFPETLLSLSSLTC